MGYVSKFVALNPLVPSSKLNHLQKIFFWFWDIPNINWGAFLSGRGSDCLDMHSISVFFFTLAWVDDRLLNQETCQGVFAPNDMPVYGDWSRPLAKPWKFCFQSSRTTESKEDSLSDWICCDEWTFWTLLAFLVGLIFATSNFMFGAKTSKRNQSCWSENLWGETGFAYFHPDGCDEVWDGFFEVFSLTFFPERIQFLKVVQLEWIRKDHQKHETSRCRISCWTAGWFHDAFIAVVRPVSNRSATMILHARHGYAVSAVRGCLEVQMSKIGNTTYHVFIFLHY